MERATRSKLIGVVALTKRAEKLAAREEERLSALEKLGPHPYKPGSQLLADCVKMLEETVEKTVTASQFAAGCCLYSKISFTTLPGISERYSQLRANCAHEEARLHDMSRCLRSIMDAFVEKNPNYRIRMPCETEVGDHICTNENQFVIVTYL